MKVEEVMTAKVRTCRPESSLSEAAMQMWEGDCGVLPVVAADGKVVGMITDRDICMAAATKHRGLENIRVDEVISGEAYSCSPEADIHEALETMQERRVRRLPVISRKNGKLVGILSTNDVALKAQTDASAELSARDMENTLRAICAHRIYTLAKPLSQITPKVVPAEV